MPVTTAIYNEIEARNRPSFYAPPLAWAAAHFADRLIRDEGGIVPLRTGMIVVSDECSLETIRELSSTAARGAVSPLRFAGASPSIVAGLPALEQGIRGPTLCLTMPPKHAPRAVAAIVDHWIRYGNIVSAVVIAHHKLGNGDHLFTGLIASSAGEELERDLLLLGESQPS
jgi:hypothetical protein